METLQRALEPYRHLDPPGWVGLHVYLPVWAGLLCIAVGLLMALWGGGRLFRVVAGPLGAIIGTVWVGTLAGRLGWRSSPHTVKDSSHGSAMVTPAPRRKWRRLKRCFFMRDFG